MGGGSQRRAKGNPVGIKPAQQTIFQCPSADADTERYVGRKRFLGGRIAYELDPLKQALAANVADDAMLLRQALEFGAEPCALNTGVAAQIALQNLPQDRQAGGAGDGVALKRMAFDKARILCARSPKGVGDRLPAIGPQMIGRRARILLR